MPLRRRHLLFLATLLLAAAPPARAVIGNFTFPTVELVVGHAQTVVLGRLVPDAAAPPDPKGRFRWTLEISQRLKGVPAPRIELRAAPAENESWQAIAARGGRVAVCFDFDQNLISGNFLPTDPQYAMSVASRVVYDLTRPPPMTFSMDLRRLRTADEVETAVRAAANFNAPPPPRSRDGFPHLGVPLRWANPEFASDSRSEVVLPVNGRLPALARQWMHDPRTDVRIVAIMAFSALATPDSTAALQEMLADPTFRVEPIQWWDPRIEYRARRVYDLRKEAQIALLRRGVNTTPDVEGPDTPYESVARPWPVTLAALALAVILIAGRRRPARGLACASAIAFLALGVMSWRSYSVQDCASLATPAAEYELTSAAGRLSWLRVASAPPVHGWVIRARPGEPKLWFEPLLDEGVTTATLPGVTRRAGLTVTPPTQWVIPGTNPYPFELVQIPYAFAIAPFAAWPALYFTVAARRSLRRRRWRRSNRCAHCGYDQRGNPGQICPKCGKENAR